MSGEVWVDDWPLQCGGDPVSVGSTVDWTVVASDPDWLIGLVGAVEGEYFTGYIVEIDSTT